MPWLLMLYKICFAGLRYVDMGTEIILLITSVETLSSSAASFGLTLSSFTRTGGTSAYMALPVLAHPLNN